VVQRLLSNANPNEPIVDAVGLAPLHLAAISNQIDVVKVFIHSLKIFYTLGLIIFKALKGLSHEN